MSKQILVWTKDQVTREYEGKLLCVGSAYNIDSVNWVSVMIPSYILYVHIQPKKLQVHVVKSEKICEEDFEF